MITGIKHNRESIILSMCYTWRHDYGLDKSEDDLNLYLSAGMTPDERKALWNSMAQLFDNNIAPHMVFKESV